MQLLLVGKFLAGASFACPCFCLLLHFAFFNSLAAWAGQGKACSGDERPAYGLESQEGKVLDEGIQGTDQDGGAIACMDMI